MRSPVSHRTNRCLIQRPSQSIRFQGGSHPWASGGIASFSVFINSHSIQKRNLAPPPPEKVCPPRKFLPPRQILPLKKTPMAHRIVRSLDRLFQDREGCENRRTTRSQSSYYKFIYSKFRRAAFQAEYQEGLRH